MFPALFSFFFFHSSFSFLSNTAAPNLTYFLFFLPYAVSTLLFPPPSSGFRFKVSTVPVFISFSLHLQLQTTFCCQLAVSNQRCTCCSCLNRSRRTTDLKERLVPNVTTSSVLFLFLEFPFYFSFLFHITIFDTLFFIFFLSIFHTKEKLKKGR